MYVRLRIANGPEAAFDHGLTKKAIVEQNPHKTITSDAELKAWLGDDDYSYLFSRGTPEPEWYGTGWTICKEMDALRDWRSQAIRIYSSKTQYFLSEKAKAANAVSSQDGTAAAADADDHQQWRTHFPKGNPSNVGETKQDGISGIPENSISQKECLEREVMFREFFGSVSKLCPWFADEATAALVTKLPLDELRVTLGKHVEAMVDDQQGKKILPEDIVWEKLKDVLGKMGFQNYSKADLYKAFDTINIARVIETLEWYGCSGCRQGMDKHVLRL